MMLIEGKGRKDEKDDAKETAAKRWVAVKDPGFLGGSDARFCPGGRRCSSDGQTEEVLR
jgi:hypothetical protein